MVGYHSMILGLILTTYGRPSLISAKTGGYLLCEGGYFGTEHRQGKTSLTNFIIMIFTCEVKSPKYTI